MIQVANGLRLATETFDDDRVVVVLRLHHLHGDLARERDVVGKPHLGHATLADSFLEPVARTDERVGYE